MTSVISEDITPALFRYQVNYQ